MKLITTAIHPGDPRDPTPYLMSRSDHIDLDPAVDRMIQGPEVRP
jgi:hypothetical protein